jgi:hypothetical protein
MTEERADHSRWAWDTAPTDGSPPGPVYIGDMEGESTLHSNELYQQLERDIDVKVQQLNDRLKQIDEGLPIGSQIAFLKNTYSFAHRLIPPEFVYDFWMDDYTTSHRPISGQEEDRNSQLAKKVDLICMNKELGHRCSIPNHAATTLCEKIAGLTLHKYAPYMTKNPDRFDSLNKIHHLFSALLTYSKAGSVTRMTSTNLTTNLEELLEKWKAFEHGEEIFNEISMDDLENPRLLLVDELVSKEVKIDFMGYDPRFCHTDALISICSTNKDAWLKLGISGLMESLIACQTKT